MAYIGQTPTAVALDGDDLANDIITLAKMASGTDGNIISYDASGNPVAIATGSDGQVLTSAGAGAPPAFEAAVVAGITSSANATAISIDADEIVTMPKQPSFNASISSGTDNVTGDGTTYTVVFNVENLDQNADWDGTTFTAPVAGVYVFCAHWRLDSVAADQDDKKLNIVTSNKTFESFRQDANLMATTETATSSVVCDMDAADTAIMQLRMSGGSKVNDVSGGTNTWFSGAKIA